MPFHGILVFGIAGTRVFAYDSVFGHVGCALEIEKANKAMKAFLNDYKGDD